MIRTIFKRALLNFADNLTREGVGLRSLAEPWVDTTSPSGKMVLTVFAGIAEFERSLIMARTSAGRLSAQQKGVRFGRPPKLSAEQVALGQPAFDRRHIGTSCGPHPQLPSCDLVSRIEYFFREVIASSKIHPSHPLWEVTNQYLQQGLFSPCDSANGGICCFHRIWLDVTCTCIVCLIIMRTFIILSRC